MVLGRWFVVQGMRCLEYTHVVEVPRERGGGGCLIDIDAEQARRNRMAGKCKVGGTDLRSHDEGGGRTR
jgi:hypothetical protein